MAKETVTAATWRTMMWAGVADIGLGLGLAVAALTDLIGPDLEMLAIAGGIIAVIGMGILLWARNKLSQADDRRGDMN